MIVLLTLSNADTLEVTTNAESLEEFVKELGNDPWFYMEGMAVRSRLIEQVERMDTDKKGFNLIKGGKN